MVSWSHLNASPIERLGRRVQTGLVAVALIIIAVVGAVPAEAAPVQERAAAQALFEAGRKALQAGKFDDACSKFEESDRLDPAAGTRLNLGNCEEKRGRIASAWERYLGASELLEDGDRRKEFAKQKVAQLKPRVPFLHIELSSDAPAGTRIWRDERELTGSVGVPIPLDPGSYELIIEAAGYEAQVIDIVLTEGGKKRIQVQPGAAIEEPVQTDTVVPSVVEHDSERAGTAKVAGYTLLGVGSLAVISGAAFGILAVTELPTAEAACDVDQMQCSPEAQTFQDYATYANISWLVAGAAAAGGFFLVFADDWFGDDALAVEAGIVQGGPGIRVRGAF